MPDKITDSEIVKALECCAKAKTRAECLKFKCPYKGECYGVNLYDVARDLINRLQAENKNLQERNVILRGLVDAQKAENERLESLSERLGDDVDLKLKYIYELEEKLETAKAEAYKEVFEKLNKKAKVRKIIDKTFPFILGVVTLHDINELKKELVGEDNAEEKE